MDLTNVQFNIKESTADAAIRELYPKTSDLLKRFKFVNSVASPADGERDRLRKFIQDNVPAGKYDDVLIGFTPTAEQVYPNAEGKHMLEAATIVHPSGDGHKCVVLAFDGTPEQLLDNLLHELQSGKEQAIAWLNERGLCVGNQVENLLLYQKKGGQRIQLTILPE